MAAKKTGDREPREKQQTLPGTEGGEEAEKPFPDATQLALQGVKPDAIKAVENEFDKTVILKNQKKAIDGRLKDQKEKLRETMIENGVPTYGKKVGNTRWVADAHEKPELTLKEQKPDRN